jgi:hypothetical protein
VMESAYKILVRKHNLMLSGDEMRRMRLTGVACGRYGGVGRCILGFGGET